MSLINVAIITSLNNKFTLLEGLVSLEKLKRLYIRLKTEWPEEEQQIAVGIVTPTKDLVIKTESLSFRFGHIKMATCGEKPEGNVMINIPGLILDIGAGIKVQAPDVDKLDNGPFINELFEEITQKLNKRQENI